MRNRRPATRALVLATVALVLAHGVRLPHGDAPLILGWLPRDMAYRLVWMTLATVLMIWMTTGPWREAKERSHVDA